jgi:putative acetyltransferase
VFQQYQNYTIRSWQPEDRSAAAEVIRSSLAEYGLGWEADGADRDVLEVETYYLDRGGEFWVIELDGSIVGTSAYQPYLLGVPRLRSAQVASPLENRAAMTANRGEKAVEIRKMYLLPIARGQGLGRHLLGELERAIQSHGYHTIWIETASVLKSAVQLYEKNGYQPATGIETPRCDRVYVKRLLGVRD